MLISTAYQEIQEQFHEQRPDYGVSGGKHVEQIRGLAEKMGTRDILDYGCGKAMLQKGLPFPIQNYDPCMAEYKKRPKPADLVVCSDVLEHIELECLGDVLDDLVDLTNKVLFVDVACRPAAKFLPDGRNAHLLQETPNWWLTWLLPRFTLQSFQHTGGGFMAIMVPHPQEPPQ